MIEAIRQWLSSLTPFWYTMVLVVTLILVIGMVAAVISYLHTHKRPRKHHHHHHHHHGEHHGNEEEGSVSAAEQANATPIENQPVTGNDPPGEQSEHGHRRRRRRRRREHRPRNPTLAETGGLPPIRTGEPPGV